VIDGEQAQGSSTGRRRRSRGVAYAPAIVLAACLLAGCASADKHSSAEASGGSKDASMKMSAGSEGMSGMHMGAEESMSIDGIKPVPTQTLASATWEGMKITAKAMTAVPFVVYNGKEEKEIKPTPKTSFHLMVYLTDEHTGASIPYATVWAEISKGDHVYYDNRQWPMIARYMGPHYGNNVSVPGSGTYKLKLLISPPVSARHIEYKGVWLKPHRVDLSFHWKQPS
jgi:Fe2+ transport protein